MAYKNDMFLTIYLVVGGIMGGIFSDYDLIADGIIPAFLGVLIFFGVYFPIRFTSKIFKILVLMILIGTVLFIDVLMK